MIGTNNPVLNNKKIPVAYCLITLITKSKIKKFSFSDGWR